MKKLKLWITFTIISFCLVLSSCSTEYEDIASVNSTTSSQEVEQDNYSSESLRTSTPNPNPNDSISSENENSSILDDYQQTNSSMLISAFSTNDITPYSGQPYVVVNNNIPYFSENDLTTKSFEIYSDLDEIGRCGVAYANIGIDIMPTEERGEIGQIKPTGWHTVKYDSVNGKYLYNRCHLIGYQLSGENTNERNLITGTRYMNIDGMLPFENIVADYVKETENHVLYRVTPIFEGDNLLASGVLMEAQSVEDGGDGILFCVYVYNVQPDIIIDYATGESSLTPSAEMPVQTPVLIPTPTPAPTPKLDPQPQKTEEPVEQPLTIQEEPQETTYILNTNTHKFHYPYCSSVEQMSDKNKQEYTGNRDDIISMGYDPCKRCNP